MGPSPYASAFKEGEAKNMVNYSNDLNSRVQNGYQVSDNINTILGLLNEFRAGGGASFRAKLGQMAQAGLVPQSAVDALVGGKLSAAQAFDALGGQQVLSNLKTLLDGQGKIGQQEFKLLSHAMVNMDNDPNATRIVLGVTQRSVQRAQAEQAAFTEWKNSGQDVTAFPNYWRSVLNPAPQAQQKAGPQRQAPQRQARPSLNSIFGN